jgi:hypothetical protein
VDFPAVFFCYLFFDLSFEIYFIVLVFMGGFMAARFLSEKQEKRPLSIESGQIQLEISS